ncbi:MAG: sugar phosphate isomerase/epimerase [Eubacterium sp.]|nr:sugar phosphate isomerase/epimerase [Eubacterium sp.]
MKLSISNIGWSAEQDVQVYNIMKHYGFVGLEIAPTRILSDNPYDRIDEIKKWYTDIWGIYGFEISSLQSIWYGRQEKLFGTSEERNILISYTKKAIDFAHAVGCKNLVFGCPRNRQLLDGVSSSSAIGFFRELGDYAAQKETVLAMEANPSIYNTNYVNDTQSALTLIAEVNSPGFLLNLDVGTMIYNKEQVSQLIGNIKYINHVHISEPGLKKIQKRDIHCELVSLLKNENYDGFISIEMGRQEKISDLKMSMGYMRRLCDGI